MAKHPIRRIFLGIFIYSLVIFGIFFLQFRNQSNSVFNFGEIHVITTAIPDDIENKSNIYQITYKEILFNHDKNVKLQLIANNGNQQEVEFENWTKNSETEFTLNFSHNLSLTFSNNEKAIKPFAITAQIPQGYQGVLIPYKVLGSYPSSIENDNKIVISRQDSQFEVIAANITSQHLLLSQETSQAKYGEYNPIPVFAYALAERYELSQKSIMDATIEQLCKLIIENYEKNLNILSETAVLAYISEISRDTQNYTQAVRSIPALIRNNPRKTYLATPYLNELAVTSKTLLQRESNNLNAYSMAKKSNTLTFLERGNIAEFLSRQSETELENLYTLLSHSPNTPSLKAIANLLQTAILLQEINPVFLEKLSPVIANYLDILEGHFKFTEETLEIYEDEKPLAYLDAINIASALIQYGNATKNGMYVSSGILLFNSVCPDLTSIGYNALAEIHRMVAPKSKYYPKEIILDTENEKPIWAWTAAHSMEIIRRNNNTLRINTEFPLTQSHYIILNNVPPFQTIIIDGVPYKPDANFESYTSSGYFYVKETQTLLLKLRHKIGVETVILDYRPRQTVAPAPVSEEQEEPEIQEESSQEENLSVTEDAVFDEDF
ncbi:MAG: hypothetical protein E7062_02275 [Spirochaetaceae bacterium]|nr:hypothetical protein [Spirochaetaceae bacterium]